MDINFDHISQDRFSSDGLLLLLLENVMNADACITELNLQDTDAKWRGGLNHPEDLSFVIMTSSLSIIPLITLSHLLPNPNPITLGCVLKKSIIK